MSDSISSKEKLIVTLRGATIVGVILYFAINALYPLPESIKAIFVVILVLLLVYRSWLQYQITKNKTPLFLLAFLLCVAFALGLYKYLNP